MDKEKVGKRLNPKTGLPDLPDRYKDKSYNFFVKGITIGMLFVYGFGLLFAYLIHRFGQTDLYTSRLDIAKSYDMQWACFGAFILSLTSFWLNLYPMLAKARINPLASNTRANMYFLKNATHLTDECTAIKLWEEGVIGKYNRANRGVHSFIENGFSFLAPLPLALYLYTKPSMILTVLYCYGRVAYQIGYTNKGFGGHMLGFGVDRIATGTVSGLVLLAALKMF